MIKRVLMTSTLALAVSFAIGGLAVAQSSENIAKAGVFAHSKQYGKVYKVHAKGTVANNSITGAVGGTGLINVQQNGGANSIQQDTNTLGSILNSTATPNSIYKTGTLALSTQVAKISKVSSQGAGNTSSSSSKTYTSSGSKTYSSSSTRTSSSTHASSGNRDHAWNAGTDTTPEAASSSKTWNNSSSKDRSSSKNRSSESTWSHSKTTTWNHAFTAVASSNLLGSVSGTGMINISQNTGNNSMQQASNTTASVMNGQTLP